MHRLTVFLLFTILQLSAALVAESPSPGLHEMKLPLEAGDALLYSLSAPPLESGQRAPLVLALHYGGEVTPYYGMSFVRQFALPAFRELDAFILSPDCPGRGWIDPKSEAALLKLLDHALSAWPIDPQRVVVTGFSMGGIGAWFMAARHPERFSAAVPVAGQPVIDPDPMVPVYAVHSRQDTIIQLEPAQKAIESLRAQGGIAELVLVDGPTHYQTSRFAVPTGKSVRWLKKIWSARRLENSERSKP